MEYNSIDEMARKMFGVPYLFPYQRLVIMNLLEAAEADEEDDRLALGRQIVILPTGAGKSLCFQLPSLLLSGPTVVIYPTLSLMADQKRRLQERGLAPILLRGGQQPEERRALWEKVQTGESRLIISNPETLLSVRERLPELGVAHIVIDEAHCVSEWGESFRPDYLRLSEIIDAVTTPERRPLISAFTATASAPVLEKIDRSIFGEMRAHRVIGNVDRSNIYYAAQGCLLRDMAVRDMLRSNSTPAIVFCSSRAGSEKLARYLRNELRDKGVRFYHAGLSREEKALVEEWYFKNPSGVLVATCAYGMGVDKADIRTVIHRDCPPSVEAYLQESGRAGRDGLPSKALLLWGPNDESAPARTTAGKARFEELLRYARDSGGCRRTALLKLLGYEGTSVPESGCCDVCEGSAQSALIEEQALDFVRRNRRRYTVLEAASLVAQNRQLRWSEQDAQAVIYALIRSKRLIEIKNVLWKRKLTLPSQSALHHPHLL
jgi:ATP-dependent DNA helicase RecQ